MGQVSIRARGTPHRLVRWSAAAVLLLAFVVVPFLLFGDRLERWSVGMMHAEGAIAALVGIVLLVADVLLPIPSSFVLTALGTTLGGIGGTLVATLGMSMGCGLAYGLGHALGPARAERLLARDEQARLADLFARHGMLALAACRAVPVLAEASVLAAGILRLPVRRVLPATALANLGVGGCYAALGATVTGEATFAAAFVASLALPAFAMAAAGRFKRGEAAGSRGRVRRPPEGAGAKGKEDIHAV
jgi:uncharacterized membrane protein YdjX (TVP38/TMEM64 family)